MSMSQLVVLIMATPIALTSCAQPRFDGATEAKALLQRDAEWADAARAGKDVDKIVSYWSDDAMMIGSGEPILVGKAGIRAMVEKSLETPGFSIHWISRDPVFSDDGTMAYMPGTEEMTTPGPDGKLMTLHTQGLSIWRRKPGGPWLCVVDISTEAPASQAPGKP